MQIISLLGCCLVFLFLERSDCTTNFQKTKPTRFAFKAEQIPALLGSTAQLVVRGGSGAFVRGYSVSVEKEINEEDEKKYSIFRGAGLRIDEKSISSYNKETKPLLLYEFEACPFCRKVREAITILDLDVIFYPCPRGGPTFRPKAIAMGGKKQFPYLVDPNTDVSMYESDDMVQYLFDTYGDGKVPDSLKPAFSTTLSCSIGMLPRALKGAQYEEAVNMPEKPIVFYGYESSPFCKIVRERLCELELPHLLKSCARGSKKRQELKDLTGTFQVPYIYDPNTDVGLFESADILAYLDKTYCLSPKQ